MAHCRTASHHKKRHCGFTLVELLVVIGIIAVLISILLPTLTKARNAANTVACLANLRQIGIASAIYTSENNGYLVPAGYSSLMDPGITQLETWAQILVAGKYLPNPKISAADAFTIPNTRSVFYCPGGLVDDLNVGQIHSGLPFSPIDGLIARGRVNAGVSRTDSQTSATPTGPFIFPEAPIYVHNWYYINGTLNCPKLNGWTAPLPCRWVPGNTGTAAAPVFDWSLPKMTQLRRTTELVFLADGMAWQGDRDANFINGRHGSPVNITQAQTNILFFDGHAATYSRKNLPKDNPNSEFKLSGSALTALYSEPIWRTDQ